MGLLDKIKTAISIAAPSLNMIPGVGPYIGFAVEIVSDVEANMKAKTGAEKKAAALDSLADAINIWNAAHGSNFNNSSMMTHMSQLIDAVVGLANDVKAFEHKS